MFNELIKRHKLAIAFIGDVIVFVLSALVILYVRYGNEYLAKQFSFHLAPFFVVMVIWLVIFYISNLYTYKAFQNIVEIAKRLSTTLVISFFITITIFYIFSRFFELTPKANLVFLTIAFGVLDILWRYALRKIFIRKAYRSNILALASSPLMKEITEHVNNNPQLGYSIFPFNGDMSTDDMSMLTDTIQIYSITQMVVDGKFLRNRAVTKLLYGILSRQIEISTLTDFYETLFGCIPLGEIEEEWFIREITKNKSIYESMKHLVEILVIIITLPITFILSAIMACMVAATSRGPVIFRQERTGKDDAPFTLYKFRTMKIGRDGPLWTCEGDDRVTTIGKFMRYTHLDEMPQLWNVLRGDISFIGPRPERTELSKIYGEIPYYEIRHIVKPGIIGWAQINYKPSTTVEEARQKFQFDLYYIKNRSFVLDGFIFLKTIRMFFLKS